MARVLAAIALLAGCSSGAFAVAAMSAAGATASSGAGGEPRASAATTATGSGGSGGSTGSGGKASAAGTIIPLYTPPSDASWAAVASGKKAHPAVDVRAIINPDSGPGSARDPGYDSGTSALDQAGVLVLGYVATTYGGKPPAAAKAEIDRYLSWYPAVHGIFFDEMSTAAGKEGYYAALSQYAKGKGVKVTVGNPGQDTLPSYAGTVDTMFIYENSGLPAGASLGGGWHDLVPRSTFGIIPYAVPSLDGAFVAQARAHVAFIYLTDENLPNPWNGLPAYFDGLLAALE